MVKTLLKSVREFKKPSILSPIFVTLEVALQMLLPLVMAALIDGIIANDITNLLRYSLLLLGLAAFALLFGYLAGKYSAEAATGFARNLRKDIFYNVQEFSFDNIDKFSSSSLVTRMTTDITNVQNAYGMLIRVAVRAPLLLAFSIIMAFSINAELSWIFIAMIPVLAVVFYFIFTKAIPIFRRVFNKYDKLNATVEENIQGVRDVKSYVMEEHEKSKFAEASHDVRDDFIKAEKIVALNGPAFQFVLYLVLTLISVLGAIIIVETFGGYTPDGDPIWGELTTGRLSSLILYGMRLLFSLMMLSWIGVMMTLSVAAVRRISEVLSEESTLKNPESPVYDVKDGSIAFEDVCFKYDKNAENCVLEDINLQIASGSTVGILGGTGSAKSTLISLISRLYDADEGSVRVGGRDVREYDLKTLRKEVAVVLQKNVLFTGTIKDNVRWGRDDATDEEIMEVCKMAQADTFVHEFKDGYETHIEQGGSNVSGGQKQRLCIARALIREPKVLILDDSTSAVDTKTEALIMDAINESRPSMTKIIITQRVNTIKESNLIIVMDDGKVSAAGTHDELMETSPIYKEVYDLQNEGGKLHG